MTMSSQTISGIKNDIVSLLTTKIQDLGPHQLVTKREKLGLLSMSGEEFRVLNLCT